MNNMKNEKFMRALLRHNISEGNKRLDVILNELKNGDVSCAIFNKNGYIKVGSDYSHFTNYNPYKMSLRSINELFFANPNIVKNNPLMAQAYTMFYSKSYDLSVVSDKISKQNNTELLTPKIREVLLAIDNKVKSENLPTFSMLGKEEFNQVFDEYDFNTDELNQTKLAIELINSSSKTFIDYLDTYSLFHYCVYKESINTGYRDIMRNCDNPSQISTKLNALKTAVEDAYKKYCLAEPNTENRHFDCSKMRLCQEKMSSEYANKLLVDFDKLSRAEQQEIYNQSTDIAIKNPPKSIEYGKTADETKEELNQLLEGSKVIYDSTNKRKYKEQSTNNKTITQLRIDEDIM